MYSDVLTFYYSFRSINRAELDTTNIAKVVYLMFVKKKDAALTSLLS